MFWLYVYLGAGLGCFLWACITNNGAKWKALKAMPFDHAIAVGMLSILLWPLVAVSMIVEAMEKKKAT